MIIQSPLHPLLLIENAEIRTTPRWQIPDLHFSRPLPSVLFLF
jgi:hypothetical protein